MMDSSVGGTLEMGIEEEGSWEDFNTFFKHMGNKGKIASAVTLKWRDFMRQYRWWAIKGLVTEGRAVGEAWPPTVHMGLSTGIRTGHYLHAIESMKISIKGPTISLKFSEGDLNAKTHKGGDPLRKYMEYFEGGGPKQPPRPLWGPAFEKAGGHKKLMQKMLDGLKKHFDQKGLHNVTIKRV